MAARDPRTPTAPAIEPVSSSLIEMALDAQRGGAEDLDRLLVRVRPMVCRWAVVWTGSPDAAEDIAQVVLLRLEGAFPAFKKGGNFTTWLYRITRNVLIDRDRAHERQDELRDRARLDQIARTVAQRDESQSLEAVDLLQHLMEALSPMQRAVLDLVGLQGFSAKDAGEMLEVAPETVRVHLHRARQALRSKIEEEETVGSGDV